MHQLPPSPHYARVKVWRRLRGVGAVAVRNAVYVLPRTPEASEDFAWIAQEIRELGGEAIVCEASFVEGVSDGDIARQLRRARADTAGTAARGEPVSRSTASAGAGRARTPTGRQERSATGRPRGATWVTRSDVHVDRIASAWLVRRFIDRTARFKFVPDRGYRPRRGEIRFDMFEGEYTHVGEACTFEVLTARFAPGDRVLRALGEVIHDIDCKDNRYRRPEMAGVEAAITGICRRERRDPARLTRGALLFDALYAALGVPPAGVRESPSRK